MLFESIDLKPPKDIADKVQKEVERAEFHLRSRRLRLSTDKKTEIERELDQKYQGWKKQTNKARKRLIALNDLLEGVVQETNFPFEGASNIATHYSSATSRTFRSNFNNTVFQDPNIFIVRQYLGINDEQSTKLQAFCNNTFNTETNGMKTLKSGTIPLYRDGTMILAGHWERRIERGSDTRTYIDANAFLSDYPSAEDAGVSGEEYGAILDKFLVNSEIELRVEFNYDFIKYEGPEYEIIPFSKFIYFPIYMPSLDRMEGYGKYYFLSREEIEQRGKRSHYYKDSVERLIDTDEVGQRDTWTSSRDFIEGISQSPAFEKKPYEMIDLVWRKDLDGDGISEKYLVTFAANKKVLMSIEHYPIRRNIDMCIPFRLIRRDDRFPGVSVMASSQDLFEQIDVLHRHRNNIRQLVASPVFIANKRCKEDLDFGRYENVIKPGTTFWVDDINNAARQVELRNLDQPGNSIDEEQMIIRYIELDTGTTQGMSGKQTPDDPRAPMGKTLALLKQSGMRIDDYADEYGESVPLIAELHIALNAQYGPTEGSKYAVGLDGRAAETVEKEVLSAGVKWGYPKRSSSFSPEYIMKRIGGLMQVYAQLLPFIMQNDQRAIEMWNRMVVASGEPDFEKLLIRAGPAGPSMVTPMAPPAGAQDIPQITQQPQSGVV